MYIPYHVQYDKVTKIGDLYHIHVTYSSHQLYVYMYIKTGAVSISQSTASDTQEHHLPPAKHSLMM